MDKAIMIGLDIAKTVFEVHGRDAAGEVVLRRSLKRGQVEKFFAKQPAAVIGLGACGAVRAGHRVHHRHRRSAANRIAGARRPRGIREGAMPFWAFPPYLRPSVLRDWRALFF
jgi:transposase